jgi:hypothetical protein
MFCTWVALTMSINPLSTGVDFVSDFARDFLTRVDTLHICLRYSSPNILATRKLIQTGIVEFAVKSIFVSTL